MPPGARVAAASSMVTPAISPSAAAPAPRRAAAASGRSRTARTMGSRKATRIKAGQEDARRRDQGSGQVAEQEAEVAGGAE